MNFVKIVLCLSFLIFIGCDPAYVIHYRVNVHKYDKPIEGAWSLTSTNCKTSSSAKTDTMGMVQIDSGGFLCHPVNAPLFVYKKGLGLRAFLPWSDFKPKKRGLFFSTEWDASVDVSFSTSAESNVSVACNNKECEVILLNDKSEFCWSYILKFSDSAAGVFARLSSESEPEGSKSTRFKFVCPSMEKGTSEVFFAAVCHSTASNRSRIVVSGSIPTTATVR